VQRKNREEYNALGSDENGVAKENENEEGDERKSAGHRCCLFLTSASVVLRLKETVERRSETSSLKKKRRKNEREEREAVLLDDNRSSTASTPLILAREKSLRRGKHDYALYFDTTELNITPFLRTNTQKIETKPSFPFSSLPFSLLLSSPRQRCGVRLTRRVRRVTVPEDLETDAVFERHYEGEKVRMGERREGREE
jgi:hypothetical protein